MEEVWKNYKESIYEVSSFGNVRSNKKGVVCNLKPHRNDKGYLKLNISVKKVFVHRMVAETFIPLSTGRAFVNHKNGIKTDNTVDNLEWCTRQENNTHAYENKLVIAVKSVVYDITGVFLGEYQSKSMAYSVYKKMSPKEYLIIPKDKYTPEYLAELIRIKTGPRSYSKRIVSQNRGLSSDQVILIRELLQREDYYPAKIGRLFYSDTSVIIGIKNGKLYTDVV